MCREPAGRTAIAVPVDDHRLGAAVESAGSRRRTGSRIRRPSRRAGRSRAATRRVPDIDQAISVRPSELKSASSGSAEFSSTDCGTSDVPRDANTCSRSVQLGVQPAAPPQPSTCTRSSRSPRPSPLKSAARSVDRKRCDAVTNGCAAMRVPCDAVQSTASAAKLARSSGRQVPAPRDRSAGIPDEDEVVQPVAIDIDESRAARGRDVGDSCGRVRIRRARSLAQPLPGVSAARHHDVAAPVAVEVSGQRLGRRAVRSEPRVDR